MERRLSWRQRRLPLLDQGSNPDEGGIASVSSETVTTVAQRFMHVVAAAFACVAAICGCGSTAKPITPNQRYCLSGCGKVSGVVERCGGPYPGTCMLLHVVSVDLRDSRGRPALSLHAGAGETIDRFSLLVPAGRYTLESTVAGQRIERSVDVQVRHTTRANLIAQIK
ncbi:MAG: hypothetical protein ACYDHH_27040 [Solirubrobacteraceae bacterium]